MNSFLLEHLDSVIVKMLQVIFFPLLVDSVSRCCNVQQSERSLKQTHPVLQKSHYPVIHSESTPSPAPLFPSRSAVSHVAGGSDDPGCVNVTS